jgi:hypothetical protein
MGFPVVGQNGKLQGKGALHYALIDDAGAVSPDFEFAGNSEDIPFAWDLAEEEVLSGTEGPAVIVDTYPTKMNLVLSPKIKDFRLGNLMQFLLGTTAAANQSANATVTGSIDNIVLGKYRDIGVRRATGLVVSKDYSPLESGVDYIFESESGLIFFPLTGGVLIDGDDLTYACAAPALTIDRIAMGKKPVRFVQLTFQANDPNSLISSKDRYVFWKARMAPAGDLALVGTGQGEMPFKITIYPDSATDADHPWGYADRISA